MTYLPPPSRSRAGFTLIELLVVIAIIAILVSLLGAGIFYAYVRMQDTGARNEITQLNQSVQAFKAADGKTGGGRAYFPDRFRLYSNATDYATDIAGGFPWSNPPLAQRSISFINAMWSNIGQFQNLPWCDGVPGHGFGQGSAQSNPYFYVKYVDLDPDQCLVFFLSGIPAVSNITGVAGLPQGFSTNPKDPVTNNGGPRTKVFYEFNTSRFIQRPNQNPSGGAWPNQSFPQNTMTNLPQIFYSYGDYFGNGTPYIYFSSNNIKNGYEQYAVWNANGNLVKTSQQFVQLPPTDPLNGNGYVYPYFQPLLPTQPPPKGPPTPSPTQQFLNPTTFQIITAGRDGAFNCVPANMAYNPPNNPGNYPAWSAYIQALYVSPFQWSPTNTSLLLSPAGKDDLTNFWDNKLGIGQ